MRYPQFLKEGGGIGFIAPSFGCSIEPYKSGFENAIKKWKEQGYAIALGPNCYASSGIGISNLPEECAKEVMSAFAGSDALKGEDEKPRKSDANAEAGRLFDVDVIISCGGGEL
ncbi:MAG: hypothetical protein IJU50_02460, partial [Lachnospiraceae bacterium]|nr:hypothetical protein [Lachnospiraceae bacterium]